MKRLLFLLLLAHGSLAQPAPPAAAPPHVSTGTVRRFAAFPSKFVAARTVDVWLPDGYPKNGPYDVLYMHDGQTLFDSINSWNHQEWRVDEVLGRLEANKAVRPTIVVSSFNNGPYRHAEYYPQRAIGYLAPAVRDTLVRKDLKGQPLADAYLKFMVQELKPFVDKTFRTRPGPAHTRVMGSSMGGLISLYALCEYPQVFGGAACLSTHWIGGFGQDQAALAAAFQQYLKARLPDPATHRLYFDYGTATLDALYEPHQLAADAILRARGYSAKNWTTRKFEGADHSEHAWAKRLDQPLRWLLQ